jgi:3-deoxy-D-arabino-heptulosonate 7-phosphate (DAHP) synthase class II
MAWTLGSIPIIVVDQADETKQIIARLQPLNGATIKQVFGYETTIFKIRGYVVGTSDLNTLKGYAQSSTTRTLSEGATNWGSFVVASVSSARISTISQTIMPTYDCLSPVFTVDVELQV